MGHPEWAVRHKKPGTELRCINNRYYLYAVSSQWNPEKKRAQKKTGKILGSITEEGGFKESAARKRQHISGSISVREYGASHFLQQTMDATITALQASFPDDWESIFCAAFCRLMHQSPLKNMAFHLSQSMLSETHKQAVLSPKAISTTLERIGSSRDVILEYTQAFTQPGSHLLVDITNIPSQSRQLDLAQKGYNNKWDFDPQVNLLMVFSQANTCPLYYRLLPGNIRDVSSFKLSLQESGIKDAVLIADKGFYSQDNVAHLDQSDFGYILPIRRNSALIDYGTVALPAKKGFQGRFKYRKRYIWYNTKEQDGKLIHVFVDDALRVQEESDYLDRIQTHPESHTEEGFQAKLCQFGSFSVLTNLTTQSAEEVYNTYKSRVEIEVAFDAFKNTLDADRTYMRRASTLEGWMFINFIALQWYYQIYQMLKQKALLSKYSVADVLMHCGSIKKIKLGDKWQTAEINAKTQKLLKGLDIDIT